MDVVTCDRDRYHVCPDAEQRFWAMVDRRAEDECWLWRGKTARGYGGFAAHGRCPTAKAHRYAYQLLVGPIPDGLELDHLCRVRNCVNPTHLEPVTPQENQLRADGFPAANARKTHCPQGHPYDESNTVVWGRRRTCRTCANARARRQEHTAEQKARWAANRAARRRTHKAA